jgi:hypothetical protein
MKRISSSSDLTISIGRMGGLLSSRCITLLSHRLELSGDRVLGNDALFRVCC